MHDFVSALARNLSLPNCAAKAINYFDRQLHAASFRWGKSANHMAGACLCIALRDSNLPERIPEVAEAVDCSENVLRRNIAIVSSTLDLHMRPSDTSSYIHGLQGHLYAELSRTKDAPDDSFGLPTPLIEALRPVSLPDSAKVARDLCELLAKLSPTMANLPAPPTACAVFILALENISQRTLPNLAQMALWLGNLLKLSQSVIMKRYQSLQDEIITWMHPIPWLDSSGKPESGRRKVSKRLHIARSLADIIKWYNDKDAGHCDSSVHTTAKRPASPSFRSAEEILPQKKPRKLPLDIYNATQFLLNPLKGPLPAFLPISGHIDDCSSVYSAGNKPSEMYLPLPSYILSTPLVALKNQKLPTRLQGLALLRGGSGFDEVADEELLDDGEFEAIKRTQEEMETLRVAWGYTRDEGNNFNPVVDPSKCERSQKKVAGSQRQGSRRINQTALDDIMKYGFQSAEQGQENSTESERQGAEKVNQSMSAFVYKEGENRHQRSPGIDYKMLSLFEGMDDDPTGNDEMEQDANLKMAALVFHSSGFDDDYDSGDEDNEDGRYGEVPDNPYDDDATIVMDGWYPLSP
jgi:transcription factor IIIB 90 kDa subunit